MSWDFRMEIEGGEGPIDLGKHFSLTWNLGPMLNEAAKGTGTESIRDFLGKSGRESEPILREMIARMKADPEKFRAMNPPNGWGTYEVALEALEILRGWCEWAPNGRLIVT